MKQALWLMLFLSASLTAAPIVEDGRKLSNAQQECLVELSNIGRSSIQSLADSLNDITKYNDSKIFLKRYEEINTNFDPEAKLFFCSHVELLSNNKDFKELKEEALEIQKKSGKPQYEAKELNFFLSCSGTMGGKTPLQYIFQDPKRVEGKFHPNVIKILKESKEYLLVKDRDGKTFLDKIDEIIESYKKQPAMEGPLNMYMVYRGIVVDIIKEDQLEMARQRECQQLLNTATSETDSDSGTTENKAH
ncbi:MAG: hypothetical protein R3F22_05270 [Lysobacteraceae bacterium]